MDLSMSSSSIPALGLLTNSEALRLIPQTELKTEVKDESLLKDKKDEVKLIFFGTFFHDSNELNADLVQIKEPTQIKEVRVIPLGATVNLSTGSYQLGATNPSELELEFYYNDLQVPSKSAFTLLQNFSFNDKCRIQLNVDPEDQIITDGLIVRGVYSTITLAVYGFPVDEVPVKELASEKPVVEEKKENVPVPETVAQDLAASPIDLDSPKKLVVDVGPASDNVLISPNSNDGRPLDRSKDLTSTPISETKRGIDVEEPQAIPTITTRITFDSPFSTSHKEKAFPEEPIDRERIPVESDLSSDDQFESSSENLNNLIKPQVKPVPPAPVILQDLEDAEDISDGEVFPEEDDIEMEEKDVASTIISSAGKVSPPPAREALTSSPAIEPLSDQDNSSLDEFPEAGIEEIISDEEMPDFPEYVYGEMEDQWQIFGPSFNPFSENFRVSPLKNFKVSQTLGPVAKTFNEMMSLLELKAKEWSKNNFSNAKIEAWVQDMEELIPMIPRVCTADNETSEAIKEALLYWTTIGIDLSLAKQHPQIPFKTRHIKVGIKLLHALSISDEKIIEALLKYKVDEDIIEGGQTIQHKLIEIFEEQYMSTTMRLSILRALDCMILTKAGFKAFVGDDDVGEDENTCYARLLEFSLDKNVGTRVSFSIRSFLNKVKLLEDLNAFEDFVLGIVKNSSSELSTSVEAQDVDDCVHILETLRDMAKKVDQYLSHPLRILPAGSLVELPSTSVTGHDPKISFIKALEQYQFLKLSTVLVNNKDLYGRTGGLVSEIISILLEWEPGLVYLCSEGESTTILLKTLAQLEDDGTNYALYACHCLEVIKCIDKLIDSEILESEKSMQFEEDKNDDIGCLQTLVSFLSTPFGRQCLSATLTIGDLIFPLLNCLKPAKNSTLARSRRDKSVMKGYASKIITFIVKNGENSTFLMKHGSKIHEIISGMEEDPEGLTENLSTVLPYLRPTLEPLIFSLEGLEELFNIVRSSVDTLLRIKNSRNNWGYPPEVTTALRLLCALVLPNTSDDVKNCIAADVDDMLIKELKYDVALVKLHSLNATAAFLTILQKIIDDFNGHPATQSYSLVSERGDAMINLLSPLLKLFRRITSQVVHVRKTDFKDTSGIPVLLRLYTIIECIPVCAPCYRRSREVGQTIIGNLLAYTIPALKQGVETEEELNKSTWTALISEIIKYTMEEPATFITGVGIFSELLPLPLPIASKIPLTEAECVENVKLRRLWSAYIHGLSAQIQEMIGVLCYSTNSKLITLLKRLCVQLADLSGSTCMVVCRAILDSIFLSIENDMEVQQQSSTDLVLFNPSGAANSTQISSIKAWLDQSKNSKLLVCSGNTARLLGFMSSLINNSGTVKSGMMQALRGVLKLDERYTDLITHFCCMVINQQSSSSPTSHVQAQENIVSIFQSLCDQEINVVVPMYGYSGKIYDSKFVLANSLPPKDLLITICNALMNYVATTPYKFSESRIMESVLRGLEIIAETEYGFYHMRSCIEKTSGIFKNILVALSVIDLTRPETFEASWSCISSILELLRSLTSPRHGTGSNVTNRASVLTRQEFKSAVDWQGVYKQEVEENQEEDSTEPIEDEDSQKVPSSNPTHPLNQILKLLQKFLHRMSNNSATKRQEVTIEVTEIESTIAMLASVLEFLEEEKESFEIIPETVLPPPDLLQDLFSKRPVFVIVEKLGSENLPPFWLTSIPPAFDLDSECSESDLIQCDLNELCQSQFTDLDIVKEVERFYKSTDASASVDKEDVVPERPKIKITADGQAGMVLSPLTVHRKPFISHLRGSMRGGFSRGLVSGGRGLDPFRSRPPNTSRPPSLHVDDFVALESSGQSGSVQAAYNKGGMRPDNFNSRGGRGNPRGTMLGRGYNDRGRFRPLQSGSSYFGNRMEGQQSSIRRGSRGGPGNKGYGDQRWSTGGLGDNRDSPYGGRPDHSVGGGRPMYEDKFRSSPMRSQGSVGPGGGNIRNQPYPSRNPYREAPPMGRNNNNPNNNNMNSAPRWRERQRPFNR